MSGPSTTCPIDLRDPGLLADPIRGFSRIREESPMTRALLAGRDAPIWLATRYEDVAAVLSDQRFVNDPANVPGVDAAAIRERMLEARGIPREYARYLFEGVLDADGADHLRLRRLVSRAFTPRRVQALRPRVEKITEELCDRLPGTAEHGVADLMEHFAYPLPITVISELVGIPEADRPRWRAWGRALTSLAGMRPGALAEPVREMVGHISDLIAHRRGHPADDLLTGLIRAHDEQGDRLTDAEMITMVVTLVFAGHETTAHLIGNTVAALLAHPDQLARLRADPGLLPGAVHEFVRRCSPIHGTRLRYATEDIEVGGVTIRRGEAVMAVLVAANHDPRHFADPERFDITRQPDPRRETHLGFGHGPHYCLGAALARQEAEVAIGTLLRRFPGLRLAVPPERLDRQPVPMFWRLARLPVRLGP